MLQKSLSPLETPDIPHPSSTPPSRVSSLNICLQIHLCPLADFLSLSLCLELGRILSLILEITQSILSALLSQISNSSNSLFLKEMFLLLFTTLPQDLWKVCVHTRSLEWRALEMLFQEI